MKRMVAVAAVVVAFLGIFSGSLEAITKTEVKQIVADWAGVPVETITSETQLDGLGGRAWTRDTPSLVSALEAAYGQAIPPSTYLGWDGVIDIENDLGADDDDEEE